MEVMCVLVHRQTNELPWLFSDEKGIWNDEKLCYFMQAIFDLGQKRQQFSN